MMEDEFGPSETWEQQASKATRGAWYDGVWSGLWMAVGLLEGKYKDASKRGDAETKNMLGPFISVLKGEMATTRKEAKEEGLELTVEGLELTVTED